MPTSVKGLILFTIPCTNQVGDQVGDQVDDKGDQVEL